MPLYLRSVSILFGILSVEAECYLCKMSTVVALKLFSSDCVH